MTRNASRNALCASSAYIHCEPTRICRLNAIAAPAVASTLEREIQRFGLFRAYRDLLFLLAILLVPRHDRILARREIGNRERAVGLRNGIERVRHYGRVRLHPAMDVAFDLESRHLRPIRALG